jgi:plastocyanin
MRSRWGRNVVAAIALLALALAGGVGGVGSAAQEGTPGSDADAHPAHVHEGSCAELDPSPAYPLTDVAPMEGATEGATSALPVAQSATEIEVALDDLLADPYAINVHLSAEESGTYIACGDIGGTLVETDDGRSLAIGLAEQNDSGFAGVAVLAEDGDDGTTVTIYLTGPASDEAGEDDGGTAGAEEVAIDIVDFAFEPAEVEVSVGTTVTWTNVGPTDHTTTAYVDGDKFWDSAIMAEGDTFSFTFEEPGSYDYLCALHPSMTAHLEVVE